MPKKSDFREAFDKQHGKQAQILLKPEQQHLYHIYWSLRKQFSWKKSLLRIWKVLALFVNKLTSDDVYSLLNKDNLTEPIQILLSEKEKAFSQFSFAFLKFRVNFDQHSSCIFQITDSEINDKCLKSSAWEDPSKGSMIKGSKRCCNLKNSTFTILIDHCEGNWVGKSLFHWYTKC